MEAELSRARRLGSGTPGGIFRRGQNAKQKGNTHYSLTPAALPGGLVAGLGITPPMDDSCEGKRKPRRSVFETGKGLLCAVHILVGAGRRPLNVAALWKRYTDRSP